LTWADDIAVWRSVSIPSRERSVYDAPPGESSKDGRIVEALHNQEWIAQTPQDFFDLVAEYDRVVLALEAATVELRALRMAADVIGPHAKRLATLH
jgi:hypothetical protein